MNDFDNWARWFVLDLTKNSDGEYVCFSTKSALEAWNHQQQKIDMQECVSTEIKMILNDNVYSDAEKIERIEELLK